MVCTLHTKQSVAQQEYSVSANAPVCKVGYMHQAHNTETKAKHQKILISIYDDVLVVATVSVGIESYLSLIDISPIFVTVPV